MFFPILLCRKIKHERAMKKDTRVQVHGHYRCAVKKLVGKGHLLLRGALDSVNCRKTRGNPAKGDFAHVILSYIKEGF